MSEITRDEFSAMRPAALGAVTIGSGDDTEQIVVRAMDVVQLSGFARAVRPIFDDVAAMLSGEGDAASILGLIEHKVDAVIDALSEATLPHRKGEAPDQRDARLAERREILRITPIDGLGELLLAVLGANKDFLRGRLTAALRTAATLNLGAGQTPSRP